MTAINSKFNLKCIIHPHWELCLLEKEMLYNDTGTSKNDAILADK